MKMWIGVMRGRTPKALQSKRKNSNYNESQGRTEKVIAHCEEEPEAGGRILSSPKQSPARANAPQSVMARISRTLRKIGASSPSGNARGRMSEGGSFRLAHTTDAETQYLILIFLFVLVFEFRLLFFQRKV